MRKLLMAAAAATMLALAVPGAASTACIYNQPDTSGGGIPGGNTWIDPFTAAATDTVSSIQIYVSASDNAYVGIYADNSGVPGLLLGTSSLSAVNSGWNTLPLTSTVDVTASTAYWVAVGVSSPGTFHGSMFNASSGMYKTGAFGPLVDNPAASSAGNTDTLSIIIGTCAGPGGTSTETPVFGGPPSPTMTETPFFGPPSPVDTATSNPTATLTASRTATPSVSPSSSKTLTVTPSNSPTISPSPTFTATRTGTPTISPSPTFTATRTGSPTTSPSPTSTPTRTNTPTISPSPTSTPTSTATPTASPSPTATPRCIVSTLVGTGVGSSIGDGFGAVTATVNLPYAIALDPQGRLLIAEKNGNKVRRIAANGTISTVAGTGIGGAGADGVLANASMLSNPSGLAVDGSGAIFISDFGNHRVRRVDPVSGLISTVAGTGTQGSTGLTVTALATGLPLNSPNGLAIASNGDLYIADTGNHAVRKVTAAGMMSTVLGTGSAGFSALTQAASSAQLNLPQGVSFDLQGRLLIADTANNALRRLDAGVLSTLAGTGASGFAGLGATVVAATAQLSSPTSAVVDGAGTIYISELGNQVIRQISGGNLSPLGGTGSGAFNGDGLPALLTSVNGPEALLVSDQGDLLLADSVNNRVRRLASCGIAPFVRPALPACYQGVVSARTGNGKAGLPAAGEFGAILAPNPAVGGSELCVSFNAPVESCSLRLYDLSGTLLGQHAEAAQSTVCFKAPAAPGVYFIWAEARSALGLKSRQLLKLAVVKP